jgi:hypothetical protein
MPAVAEKTDTIAEEASFKDSFGAKIEAMAEGKPIEKVEPKAALKAAPKVEKAAPKAAEVEDADDADPITPASAAEPEVDPDAEIEDADAPTTVKDDDPDAGADADDLDDEEDDEPEEDELAEEAKAALIKHGLKLTLDDVPKEFRPIIQAQVQNARTASIRALQEQRAYRKEEAQYRAKELFDEKHAARRVVELLHTKDGALNEELYKEVNDLMAEMETATGKKSFAIINKDERASALKAIETETNARDTVKSRGDEMVAYVARAATKLDLDFEALSDAIAAKIALSDTIGLTDQEMDAVIGRFKRHQDHLLSRKKLTQRKSEIQGRTEDKKTISPVAKGKGAAATPAGAKLPKNDEEFKQQFLAKYGSR